MVPKEETVQKLRKLQKYILEEPKRFNLNFWGAHADPKFNGDEEDLRQAFDYDLGTSQTREMLANLPPCGTVGCIAGNICVLEGIVQPVHNEHNQEFYTFDDDTCDSATKALGITDEDAEKLFYLKSWSQGDGWPRKYEYKLFETVPGSPEYAQVAVDRIEHYIKTGE